jgi:hypothetical protein
LALFPHRVKALSKPTCSCTLPHCTACISTTSAAVRMCIYTLYVFTYVGGNLSPRTRAGFQPLSHFDQGHPSLRLHSCLNQPTCPSGAYHTRALRPICLPCRHLDRQLSDFPAARLQIHISPLLARRTEGMRSCRSADAEIYIVLGLLWRAPAKALWTNDTWTSDLHTCCGLERIALGTQLRVWLPPS